MDIDQRISVEKRLSSVVLAFIRERQVRGLADRTIEFYNEKITPFMTWIEADSYFDGHQNIELITSDDIRRFIEHLRETHSPGGVKSFYSVLRAFFRFYESEFEPENWKNPINKVKLGKIDEEPIVGVTQEQVKILVSVARNIRDKAILTVLFDTGCRVGEVIRMTWEDVDFYDSSILIKKSKSRKVRSVFFGQTCRSYLRKMMKESTSPKQKIFLTDEGAPLTQAGLRQALRRLCVRAGIVEVSPHDFRRGFTLALLQKNVDILTISRLLGHSTTALVAKYANQQKTHLADKYISVYDS